MNILVISSSGDSLPLCWRMMKEGADVRVYIHLPGYQKNYDGIMPKVKLPQIRSAVKDADAVLFDMNRHDEKTKEDAAFKKIFGVNGGSVFGPVADRLRQSGKTVIGGSIWTDTLEMDREYGARIAQEIGLKAPESRKFESTEAARYWLKSKINKLWVLKPLNNADLDLTYVEKFPGELSAKFEADYRERIKGSFIIQEKIEGTEFSTEGWWTGSAWKCFNHTLEQKRMMNFDLGPSIGSQANCVWSEPKPLLIENFNHMGPMAKRSGYVGPIDINCILKDGSAYFLEFTPRLGYDAAFCLSMLINGSLTEFLTGGFKTSLKDGFAASQRVSIPPYPYQSDDLLKQYAEDVPVNVGLDEMHMQDVYRDVKQLRCAGADGIIGCMTRHGNSIGGAFGNVYRALQGVKIGAYVQYRTDSPRNAEQRHGELYGSKDGAQGRQADGPVPDTAQAA